MTVLQKADLSYKKKEYSVSIELYTKALKKHKKKRDVASFIKFRIAECYRLGNNYAKAAEFYEKALKDRYDDPVAYLYYADMLMLGGDYESAKDALNTFLEGDPDNEIAKRKLESCDFAIKAQGDSTMYTVMNITAINSDYSEFGIAYIDENFIFASSRMGKKDKAVYTYTGQGFSDFYETKLDVASLNMKRARKVKGEINSDFNDGTITYDKASSTAYLMQCNGFSGKDTVCKIYSSSFVKKKWTSPKLLKEADDGYNTGHPSISETGEVLYFVSDNPEGEGATDIWMLTKEGEKWGKPVNAGKNINTPGKEMFPYSRGDTLFFASDGQIGFGGLDLFYSVKSGKGEFGKPVNMKLPFNSSADDFNIIFVTDKSGFFCSNRPGGMGDDDVYSFRYIPVMYRVTGVTKDKITRDIIPQAVVVIAGSDGSLDSLLTDSVGRYKFNKVIPGIQYSVKVSKNGFFEEYKGFGGGNSEFVDEKLKLSGYIVDFDLMKITKDEIKIENIYYDYNKWSLRDSSKIELEKIVDFLNNNPGIKIMLNSHTDERGNDDYNFKLSEKRAQSVVEYLISRDIAAERLASRGWGENKLVVKGAQTEEEHQMNRRTTFNIMNVAEVDSIQKLQQETAVTSLTSEKKNNDLKNPDVVPAYKKSDVSLKVQFSAMSTPLDKKVINKIKKAIPDWDVEHMKDQDGLYKYTLGSFDNIDDANDLKDKVKEIGYDQAFIVAFKGRTKIKISEALKLLGYE